MRCTMMFQPVVARSCLFALLLCGIGSSGCPETSGELPPEPPAPSAPSQPEIAIAPTSPRTLDDLSVTLVIESDDEDGDLAGYRLQWLQNGAARAEFSDQWSVSSSETAKGDQWRVLVSAFDEGGRESVAADATASVVNTPPTAEIEATPSSAVVTTDTIMVAVVGADDDDDIVTAPTAWRIDGNPAPAFDGFTSISAGETTKGQEWTVTAVPNDGESDGDPVSVSLTILNSLPVVTEAVLSPSDPREGDTLTLSAPSEDADADDLTLSYSWFVNGLLVLDGVDPTLTSDSFDKGDEVWGVATAHDGEATGAGVESNHVTVSNTAPTVPIVEITPAEPDAGDTLVCGVVTPSSDVDGDVVTYSVSWEADGLPFGSASTTTLVDDTIDGSFVTDDQEWTCTVVPSDDQESGLPAAATASTPPACGSDAYRELASSMGAVAFWDMDDVGYAFVDSVGANDGVGAGSLSQGLPGLLDGGAATGFDGSTAFVSVPFDAALNAPAFSVSLWLEADVTSGFHPLVGNYGPPPSSGATGWTLYLIDGAIEFWVCSGPTVCGTPLTAAGIAPGTPYFVTATYDGAAAAVYIDAAPSATGSRTYTPNPGAPLCIGCVQQDTSQPPVFWFDGVIDDVAIFDAGLSTTDVEDLQDAGLCP